MNLNTYLHNILIINDDFYRELDDSERSEYLERFKNTFIGSRTVTEYYIDKYIRRTIK